MTTPEQRREKRTVAIRSYLTASLKQHLEQLRAEEGRSESDYVYRALAEHVAMRIAKQQITRIAVRN